MRNNSYCQFLHHQNPNKLGTMGFKFSGQTMAKYTVYNFMMNNSQLITQQVHFQPWLILSESHHYFVVGYQQSLGSSLQINKGRNLWKPGEWKLKCPSYILKLVISLIKVNTNIEIT